MQCKVLYEDEDLLLIAKPRGMHSAELPGRSGAPSAAGWLKAHFAGIECAAMKREDCGLINRLDEGTSGILIAARNRESWLGLRELQKRDAILKLYLALCDGHFAKAIEATHYITARYKRSAKVKALSSPPARKEQYQKACANFRPLHFFEQTDASLLQISLTSGRRHQIRAQSAALGHPLCGDVLYGSKRNLKEVLSRVGGEAGEETGFFLHAYSVAFTHPRSGRELTVAADVPEWITETLRGAGS